ncbi:hypothetical protein ACJMK2_022686 [Sinanodonta woodiana]|uniref:Zinc transporter ZIP4/12 EF-hand domain-containing protein n=1 Tax=Sinanodonta woodiana TaxID=1069815 RepID=A0ABD3TJZ5_SINWO
MNIILSLMVIQVFGGFCDSLVGRIKDERDNSDTYKDNLVLDAYHEIFFMFKIEKPDDFTVDVLNDVVEKFFDKFTCRRNLDLTATSSTGCRHTVCLNTSSLLRASGYLQGAIDKNVFQKSSTVMLNYALEKDKFCHIEVNVDDKLQYFRNHVFELLKGESNHTELHMGRLQRRLEELDDFFDEKHNHTHDNHDNENKHHGKENDDQDDVSDEDDHNERVEKIQIIKEKCISAGTLYDQMGIDIDDVLHDDDVDKLSSLIVNFMTMLKILEIGQETAESSVKSDIHDHRRKRHVHTSRPSVENDSIWNNRCYTGEQLLAIFNVATKSVITEQKFQDICPSLIQQKISGSCMKKQNSSKTNKHQPTDAERYGYGTVGKFLCCACSLGGALIIPCAGKNLYRVLMATFVGLAVGTLSGDALIHLLPEVFGAHVHEDEQHDHGNGGEIVVEPFVWSGLAVCGGIWIFYMFESVMLIARKWRNTQIEFEADQQTDITLPTRSSKGDILPLSTWCFSAMVCITLLMDWPLVRLSHKTS